MGMIQGGFETLPAREAALAQWQLLLRDDIALLAAPGAHHKTLLSQAHALHRAEVIDRDDLSDLLEQADGALAYAIEALLDQPSAE
jgi:predicted metal-dependent hydrolase